MKFEENIHSQKCIFLAYLDTSIIIPKLLEMRCVSKYIFVKRNLQSPKRFLKITYQYF